MTDHGGEKGGGAGSRRVLKKQNLSVLSKCRMLLNLTTITKTKFFLKKKF